jgi:hypothetical protein
MRGWKVVAIAVGALIAFLAAGWIVGVIIHAVIDLVIVAAIVGAVVIGIKMARSGKQVSGRKKDSEIGDDVYSRPLPRADVDHYSAPAPPPSSARQSAQDIDDELARLKREMGS